MILAYADDKNQPIQSQKKARSFKFWIIEKEGFYYMRNQNKHADRLCSYCAASLLSHMQKSGIRMTRLKDENDGLWNINTFGAIL